MEKECNSTIYACFTSYIVQALLNSFLPLLFVTLSNQYQISLSRLTLMIAVNFTVQLMVDMISPRHSMSTVWPYNVQDAMTDW